VSWSDALPNLVIGLREGLEAGLVVSILLAALRQARPTDGEGFSSAPIWLGVVGALSLAVSFAAVLSYSTSVLSSQGQEALGGALSVAAVVLVTWMVFWMRRHAAGLAAQMRGQVEMAAAFGAGALAVTAFLAVGREGLETTLFLWAAAKATGQTLAPLVGAALGLGAAVVLCWLLYRRAIHLDLGKFFSRTGVVLLVIAAGILAYGLGDLQEAGMLPGARWIAFDLTAHIDPTSWWASLVSGITELTPKMTVLQVVAWAVFLAATIPAFVRAGRTAPVRPAAQPAATEWRPSAAWARLSGRHPWSTGAALVIVPALVAAAVIVALPTSASATTAVTVSTSACAPQWSAARPGTHTFSVDNTSSDVGEINLDNGSGAVVAEIETIGPATTTAMTADLGTGSYHFACLFSGHVPLAGPTVSVTGPITGSVTKAVAPVTIVDLTPPNILYQTWAAAHLTALSTQVTRLRADLATGNLAAARTDWLAAQMTWEEVGASYDSFGAAGEAVDGLPDGLPSGVADRHFTGLHRLEYGLWHGQTARELVPLAETLQGDIAQVIDNLTDDTEAGDAANLPIRAHEILEDALRDHLFGLDDEGAGAAYPETEADVVVTRWVLDDLAALIEPRDPGVLTTARHQLDSLQTALLATRVAGRWPSPSATPLAARQRIDSTLGALVETLSAIPNLLEVHQRS